MNVFTGKRIPRMMIMLLVFILAAAVYGPAQQPTAAQPSGKGMEISDWLALGGLLAGVVGVGIAIYQYRQRRKLQIEQLRTQHEEEEKIEAEKQRKQTLTARDSYRAALREELGELRMVGPGFEKQSQPLEETFVSLRLSQTDRCDQWVEKRNKKTVAPGPPGETDFHLSPEEVMKQAFPAYPLLLVVGDPGSGKTTLLKFYALACLDHKQEALGFGKEEILPLYFPLRELEFPGESRDSGGSRKSVASGDMGVSGDGGAGGAGSAGECPSPLPLQENLAAWAKKRYLDISAEDFFNWLRREKPLVLLDGLDEIGDPGKRKSVCQWIEKALIGLKHARFVLTTRPTGYRKLEGVELECRHLRADILDFTPQQQEHFLDKWYRAVFLSELPAQAGAKEKALKEKEAKDRAAAIIAFLQDPGNKSVRELARVPMLLQIMAIIWKDRDYLPGSRSALYDISLDYLLEYRDRRRNINPLLPAEKARVVLSRLALWMQESLESDNAPKTDVHAFIGPILDTMGKESQTVDFCRNLRDRAGLISDYGSDCYIFRHKSFLEFLAALQMLIECRRDPDRIDVFIDSFSDHWWEEPLRFFISKSDEGIFDLFIKRLFQAPVSRQLDANRQTLLQHLVREAPQVRIDTLAGALHSERLNINQKRYVLDCLKTVGTPGAVEVIGAFAAGDREDKTLLDHARDIAAEFTGKAAPGKVERVEEAVPGEPPAFSRNPFEDHVEYIRIPAGTFKYSVSGKPETVTGFYLCKYPVTNKRYRRFISYLAGQEKELQDKLPVEIFAQRLREFSATVERYPDYLGKDPRAWADLLRSRFDEEKKFNGEDQPVVAVTWYAARAYCFWLSCLETVITRGEQIQNIKAVPVIYRLPTEIEWEWAAGGPANEKDGTLREYPWPKDKGDPNPNLANYGGNVGATTPVGRYPEGATPLGLMDMAGNVWEWMENHYKEGENWRAFRGGSWRHALGYLRCSARHCNHPGSYWHGSGFRVLRPQSL